ncbi:hypothetical protein EB821_03845 [Candidatus Marinimicrobia bacterium PRS2]|nr:hypothetical protein EB821_03845 [Candidatus Marinimicrobia bacterium PRS2]
MRFLVILIFMNIIIADYGGGYAGSGFRYASNAREFSLAGALVADKIPGFYTFSNPALLQFARHNQIGVSFQKMSLDRSIQSFSFAKRLPPNAGVGLAILQSGTDNIQGRNLMNQKTESFSAKEIEGIMSFGVAFGSKLALGINIKAVFATIDKDYKGNGISGDIGFIYKLNRRLLIGGIIKNLNASYNWKVIIGEEERSYEEKFPRSYSLGVAYSGLKRISLFFQEDVMITPNNDVNYRTRIGSEFKLANKTKLRFGAKQARGAIPSGTIMNSLNIKPTFGVGVPFKIWQRQYINLDYALDPGSVGEGLSHLFSFSFKF